MGIQRPGADGVLCRARDAALSAGVKVQAHDRLRVDTQAAEGTPQGHIPQEDRAVFIARHQQGTLTSIWLPKKKRTKRGIKR